MHSSMTLRSVSLFIFSAALLIASRQAVAQAGQLDSSFGQGGIVTNDFGGTAPTATGLAIQPDAKIVVCGGVPGSSGFANAAVSRFNPNGSLDTTFGSAGFAVAAGVLNVPSSIVLQSDGKIVVAGFANQITVIRFNPNGSLDSTFASGGVFNSGLVLSRGTTSAVAVQPNGKILAAGGSEMLRLLPNGQVDPGFGNGHKAMLAGDTPTALTILPSGKILVASSLFGTGGFVTRYNSNGVLDSSFGINGQMATAGPANSLVLLGDGDFLVGGDLTSSVNGPVTAFALSRFQGVGVTEAKFATRGGIVTPVAGSQTVVSSGLGIEPSSGEIVAFGTGSTNSANYVFALARYTPPGQLDTTFGTNGVVTTSFGTNYYVNGTGLAIQADGKIVAVGSYATTLSNGVADYGFKLARYLAQ